MQLATSSRRCQPRGGFGVATQSVAARDAVQVRFSFWLFNPGVADGFAVVKVTPGSFIHQRADWTMARWVGFGELSEMPPTIGWRARGAPPLRALRCARQPAGLSVSRTAARGLPATATASARGSERRASLRAEARQA